MIHILTEIALKHYHSYFVFHSSVYAYTKCPLCPRLFGIPLTQLCTEEEPVPKAVQELLLHLFRYGPNTTGIFRKSANARIAKEIKIELDEGKLRRFMFFRTRCTERCVMLIDRNSGAFSSWLQLL